MSKKEKKLSKEKKAMVEKFKNQAKGNSIFAEDVKEAKVKKLKEKARKVAKAIKGQDIDKYIESQVSKLEDLKYVSNEKFGFKVYFYILDEEGNKIGSEMVLIEDNLKADKEKIFEQSLNVIKERHKESKYFSIRDYNFKTCDLNRMQLIK